MLNNAEIPNLVQLDIKLPRLVSKLLEVMPAKYSLLIFKLAIGNFIFLKKLKKSPFSQWKVAMISEKTARSDASCLSISQWSDASCLAISQWSDASCCSDWSDASDH